MAHCNHSNSDDDIFTKVCFTDHCSRYFSYALHEHILTKVDENLNPVCSRITMSILCSKQAASLLFPMFKVQTQLKT